MSSRQSKPKLRPIDPEFWTVQSELLDPIPISTAKLDAIEQYFGAVLDVVFDAKPRTLPTVITISHKGEKR